MFTQRRIRAAHVSQLFANASRLTIESEGLDKEAAQELAKITSLTSITLRRTKIEPSTLESLLSSKSLRQLVLIRTTITPEYAKVLCNATYLKDLSMQETEGIEHILQHVPVQRLQLWDMTFTKEHAMAFKLNAHVTHLRLFGCYLKNVPFLAVSQNPFLTKLRVGTKNGIKEEELLSLGCNTTITNLRIDTCNASECLIPLANSRTIRKLNIVNHGLNPQDVEAAPLARNTTITTLGICGSSLSDSATEHLAANKAVTTLVVANNQITPKGAAALALNNTITSLDISYNKILDEGAIALARNTTITWLSMESTDMGSEGAIALSKNTTLLTLSIKHNAITREAVAALASNTILTDIAFQWCIPSDYHMFTNNKSLLKLDPCDQLPRKVLAHLHENIQALQQKVKLASVIFACLATLLRNKYYD